MMDKVEALASAVGVPPLALVPLAFAAVLAALFVLDGLSHVVLKPFKSPPVIGAMPLVGGMAAFLRGPKANGRATAPNVRGWGGRQFAIGAVFFFAYFSGELVAFQAALIALCARACSDVVQNLIDGCYWKCFLFGSVELMIAYICSSAF